MIVIATLIGIAIISALIYVIIQGRRAKSPISRCPESSTSGPKPSVLDFNKTMAFSRGDAFLYSFFCVLLFPDSSSFELLKNVCFQNVCFFCLTCYKTKTISRCTWWIVGSFNSISYKIIELQCYRALLLWHTKYK